MANPLPQKRKRGSLKELHDLAVQKGGRCLATVYRNGTTYVEWECANGHRWKAPRKRIKRGDWCPQCSLTFPGSIQEMHELANEKNGRCLSKSYINSSTPLKWQCENGHIWSTRPANIKRGSWCPDCAGNIRHSLEYIQSLAESRGGKCLSTEYKNAHEPMKWMCGEGHVWTQNANHIITGTWCQICAGVAKLTIDVLKNHARKLGGRLISKKYEGAHHPLDWQCADGHIWAAAWTNIDRGKWCPLCSSTITEELCRSVFEKIFSYSFPRKRPKWLINSRGNRMELDGYCRSLNIAFEYQGEQHFRIGKFTPSAEELEKRQRDDVQKREICNDNGVTLVIINYGAVPDN